MFGMRERKKRAERNANWMRRTFLDAQKENMEALGGKAAEDQYSPKMLEALKKMAASDVFPDNRFSDMDFMVWSMFR